MAISKMGLVICLTLACADILIGVSAQCQGDLQGLIKECARYVQKQGPELKPSPNCCNVVKKVDLPCVCQHITSQIEQIISMEKAVFVATSCGKPIAPGTKCGSYTVPRI